MLNIPVESEYRLLAISPSSYFHQRDWGNYTLDAMDFLNLNNSYEERKYYELPLVTCIILIVSILLKDFNSTDVKLQLTDRLNQIEAVVRTKVASSIKQMSQLDEKLENEK